MKTFITMTIMTVMKIVVMCRKYCSCDKLCQFSVRKKCPYSELFAAFGLNRKRHFVSLCIQSKCRKYGPEKLRIGHFSCSNFLFYMKYPIGVNWDFLFQILVISSLFPLPSPPFYIWPWLILNQIQWDIRTPVFVFLLRG